MGGLVIHPHPILATLASLFSFTVFVIAQTVPDNTALIISAWASFVAAIASLITAVAVLLTRRTINAVHTEVKTMNSKTIAVLADENEDRRIKSLPDDERTTEDWEHLRRTTNE